MVLAFMTVSAAFGDSTLRGLTALFIGLALGLIGIDQLTGQARLAFGLPDLLDGIAVTTLAVALFAIGETLAVVGRKAHGGREGRGGQGLGLDDAGRTGSAPGSPGCAARRSASRSAPCRPAAPTSASFLSYAAEKQLRQASRGVRPWRHRGRRRPGSRQQCLGRRHAGAAADARPADHGDRGDHAGRLPAVRPAAGTAAVRQQCAAGLGPDRQPAGRQPHAAGAQPAADRPLGEAADHPAALALCRHPRLRDAGHDRRRRLDLHARSASRFPSSSAC